MLNSKVISIQQKSVEIDFNGEVKSYANDAVIVCAGGLLPTPLLQKIGIRFETKFGN
jgi:thioredoxin reductase (NADPH)